MGALTEAIGQQTRRISAGRWFRFPLRSAERSRLCANDCEKMATVTKAGRYEIVKELGRGAMGVVYQALDPVIGRTVAVKTIRLSEEGTGLTRPELLARFQTEARAAGLLTHPNIVVVFDAGEEDGLYFITMELVEGKSLQALIDTGHEFPLPRVLRIMEQTCSALQFAHERNVVHRDIKPANLMLTADDTVKVTDFGTAKILQFGTAQQTAHVMGTPSYMSPEQVKGRAVDGRSDIFSLGVMLYEIMTGEKPFPGPSITTVIYKIVNEEPIPPREINPAIHPGMSAVIMKALTKEPSQRYQNCREMLEELRDYRSLGRVLGGGDAQSTINMMRASSPGATAGFDAAQDRTTLSADPALMATARSLASRTPHPGQTPLIRRTGPVAPYKEPKKKNIAGTLVAAVALLGLIGYGGLKLRPVFEDARQGHDHQATSSAPLAKDAAAPTTPTGTTGASSDAQASQATAPADTQANPNNLNSPNNLNGAPVNPTTNATNTSPGDPGNGDGGSDKTATESAPTETVMAEKAATEKVSKPRSENELSAKAAEYAQHIEGAIAKTGLTSKVKVQGVGNTLALSGKLRPAEHGALLKFLRNAPAGVRVVDHIEYEDTPDRSAGNEDAGSHPIPGAGRGTIHVVTDVIGATALLLGPGGRILNRCQTPCSFNNLYPEQYSLEVQKDGYQPVQTALQVNAGRVQDERVKLMSLAKGLYVSSQPAGADVLINGAKQPGQTPVTLPLAPGSYNLVLRLPGYEPYSTNVQVKDNIQTLLDTKLREKSESRVAWAQVTSSPKGAEIVVDGTMTGQLTPARVQLPSGMHVVVVRLEGYQPARRTIQASEGGTVHIEEALRPK
jgi:serine/threonine protein kinase